MLDIGGDVGALLVELDGLPASGELHARRAGVGSATRPFHTGVHAVVTGAGKAATHVALFPAVRAGTYELIGPDGEPRASAVVTGGQVARCQLSWEVR